MILLWRKWLLIKIENLSFKIIIIMDKFDFSFRELNFNSFKDN